MRKKGAFIFYDKHLWRYRRLPGSAGRDKEWRWYIVGEMFHSSDIISDGPH